MKKMKRLEDRRILPFPRVRRLVVDAGQLGRRRTTIRALIEADITLPRELIRQRRKQTGETLSFTAFVAKCMAKAIDMNKQLQAYRDLRGRLVVYDDVDVQVMVEAEVDGKKVPLPYVVRAANRKSLQEIHNEIREAKNSSGGGFVGRFASWFSRVPRFIRNICYWYIYRRPDLLKKYTGTTIVSAVGMFGEGGGWGIGSGSMHSIGVLLGGIDKKPGFDDEGRVVKREFLDIAISFSHDIVDGVPAARFASRFRQLLKHAYGITEEDPGRYLRTRTTSIDDVELEQSLPEEITERPAAAANRNEDAG